MLESVHKSLPVSGMASAWTAWLPMFSDVAIFGAYVGLLCVLGYFVVERRGVSFPTTFWLLVAFLFCAAADHLLSAVARGWPWHDIGWLAKISTAVFSWLLLLGVARLVPILSRLPALAKINSDLQRDVEQRQLAETSLRRRATELERINAELEYVSRGVVGREGRILELKREINQLLERGGEPPRYRAAMEPRP